MNLLIKKHVHMKPEPVYGWIAVIYNSELYMYTAGLFLK